MENDDKPMPVTIRDGGLVLDKRLTPSECNAMLDTWRAAFPDGSQTELALQPKVRYAEKGSALDRASRVWGCAWLMKGKKRR